MGLFESLFKKKREKIIPDGLFELLTGYSPVFTTVSERLYEMELIRASIHSFASFCSKLKPEIRGSAYKNLEKTLQFRPNPFMDTSKFLYRLATILSVNNNAFIIPLEDEAGYITGYYPLLPQFCEVVEVKGVPYLRYTFSNGKRAAIEFDRVGVLTQHQYNDDFFGESNSRVLKPTMQLIHTQNQGIINGVKSSAAIRFIARLANVFDEEEIKEARARFSQDNLSEDNKTGLMLVDSKFQDVKQVDSKPFTANALQMQQINDNVYRYFGTNAAILENKYNENEFNAYFEGKVEPFALQLSLVLTNMTYTQREIAHGNEIRLTSNRLLYASNQTKLALATQLFDRGMMTQNAGLDMWGLPHVEGGDRLFIRREYAAIDELGKENPTDENPSNEGSGISGDGAAAGDSGAGDGEAV